MRFHIIFPTWPKLPEQTPFTLPPLGMIQAAACVPADVTVSLTDENTTPVDLDGDHDLIGLSILLTCQAPRAYQLAKEFKARGKTVVIGGVHAALCPDEAARHADAVVVGEGEGLIGEMIADFRAGTLKKIYRRDGWLNAAQIPNPRRALYDKKAHYTYKGWELADLVQSSRGCSRRCYACAVPVVRGIEHRIRPTDRVLSDLENCSDLIFLVDNSLEQNIEYERRLLRALAPAGKRWISHPLTPDPEILDLAREAGWLYVYHEIHTISDKIRDRIRMCHDHGIAVEGAIFLGLDHHTEDFIKRFIDFLLEIDLDLAEFTLLTPFPSSDVWHQMEKEDRIIDRDWSHYNAANVVYRPRGISPEKLQEMYFEAWRAFHQKESQAMRMSRIFLDIANSSSRRRENLRRTPGI